MIFEYRASDAVPIYVGPHVQEVEAHVFPLRGGPARFARFGGPPPMLPVFAGNGPIRSLYVLQAEARSKQS